MPTIEISQDLPLYTWIAKYQDGSFLVEYENNIQHLLKEIDQEQLEIFEITDGTHKFSVNLLTGEYNLDGKIVNDIMPKGKYRLIWFKRHTKVMNMVEAFSHRVQFILGLQTTIDDINYQQTIWVQEDGSWEILDKER